MKNNVEKNLKTNVTLKCISYVLIPILVLVIITGIIFCVYEELREHTYTSKLEYVESENYKSALAKLASDSYKTPQEKYQIREQRQYGDYTVAELSLIDSDRVNYLKKENAIDNIKIVKIDDTNKIIYTNMDLTKDTVDDYVSEIKSGLYIGVSNSVIVESNNFKNENKNVNEYIGYNLNYDKDTVVPYEIALNKYVESHSIMPYVLIILSTIFLIIIGLYQFVSIGYEKNRTEFRLNIFDKVPLECVCVGYILLLLIAILFYGAYCYYGFDSLIDILNKRRITLFLVDYIMMYAVTAIVTISIVRRIKAKSLWKTTLFYYCLSYIYGSASNVWDTVFKDIKITAKVSLLYIIFISISAILLNRNSAFWFLVLLVFWTYILMKILKYMNQLEKLNEVLKQVKDGKIDTQLDEAEYMRELRPMVRNINNIISGFNIAIEQGIKSERMKTELITNVSHDIKTPLTSIINYVDLLKKEDLKNEKANEYLDILDSKSQRLKKLIEDLVEASKVSSGNVELNFEKINMEELIHQTIAEFDDKFKEKDIKVIVDSDSKSKYYILADNRYMYRIIENVYSNIYKYALEGSRVYIDISRDGENINVSIKNISKQKLNISTDELMQRFVRGDKSRNTEGSGLGLSIAKSLAELQNGKFDVVIDGDLFKIQLVFKGI